MSATLPHICTAMPRSRFQPSAPGMALRPMLVSNKNVRWATGSKIRIAFVEGSEALRNRVREVAEIWTRYANISFEWVVRGRSDVRISFQRGTSWSRVGKEANFFQNEPTMNFGWLTPEIEDRVLRRVVLHEFGHALGCIHEHQSPASPIRWKRDEVFAYFRSTMTDAEIEQNIINQIRPSRNWQQSPFDTHSIMLYAFPGNLIEGGAGIEWNDDLSETDKAMISVWYPGR